MALFEGASGPASLQARLGEGATQVSRGQVEEVQNADAIVVLSGMLRDRRDTPLGEWSDAVDRFEGGIDLIKANKAPLLIFTGGYVPWRPNDRPEGEILKERAFKLGVPENKIQVTGKVGNTEAEASAVKELLENLENRNAESDPPSLQTSLRSDGATEGGRKATEGGKRDNQQRTANSQQPTNSVGSGQLAVGGKPSIILVTSAFHMPRAKMLFERQGFEVEPFPVDFRVSDRQRTTVLSFLPKAEYLEDSETAMREGVGVLYYKFLKH
jgi:uncharacterized SAM-binding protein YcdF (DUF218 family)